MPKRVVESEQFFTSSSFAGSCIDLLNKHFELSSFDAIVEPSAGDGSFIDLIDHPKLYALDIEPRHPRVSKADFLTWIPELQGRVLTVGNPPFGQRGALAIRFLNRAADFSDVVALIVPRSFRKYTFQSRINPWFHLVDDLDGEEFLLPSGESKSVKTVFQIWERRATLRQTVQPPDSHPDFDMYHAHLSRVPDDKIGEIRRKLPLAIRQVGQDFAPKPSASVTKGSWWFIRPTSDLVTRRLGLLDFSFLDGMNTAHKSLSRRDIVTAYLAVSSDGI